MPSRKRHNEITKALLGNDYDEVNAWMDQPAKTLGPHHRKVRHTPLELIIKYAGEEDSGKKIAAGLIHLAADTAVSEGKKRAKELVAGKISEFFSELIE